MAVDRPRKPDGTRRALISFGALLEAEGLHTRLDVPDHASTGGGLALRAWDPRHAGAVLEIEHDGTWFSCGGKPIISADSPAEELKAAAAALIRQAQEQSLIGSRAAWVKLALLAYGVIVDGSFTTWFARQPDAVRRRNFYNSPVHGATPPESLPQEVRLVHDGAEPVTVAVNVYGEGTWRLTRDGSQTVVASERLGLSWPIHVPQDLAPLRRDHGLAELANLYGGSALSFFSPRACYFFAEGTECRFCSLAGTAAETGYANRLTPEQVGQAVAAVLAGEPGRINQVMIVGGNERNLDHGFTRHVELARAASRAISEASALDRVSVHLVTMPPRDHGLIDELATIEGIHVGFNLEAWDRQAFMRIAPGKTADYGQVRILSALQRLVAVVGPYRAHSILIAGLEPAASTLAGAEALAELGVSPIINAYHSDVHSALGLTVRPSYEELAAVASGLSDLHARYPIRPYWTGCGRNALDYEASLGMFAGDPLPLGAQR